MNKPVQNTKITASVDVWSLADAILNGRTPRPRIKMLSFKKYTKMIGTFPFGV